MGLPAPLKASALSLKWICIDRRRHDALETADAEGTNISALLRKLVDQYREAQQNARLEMAVRELKADYETNQELLVFTALDGEDFE